MDKLSDLEIVTRCARAMEIEHFEVGPFDSGDRLCGVIRFDNGFLAHYDPLHDDAQAMALVKQFKLNVFFEDNVWGVGIYANGFDAVSSDTLNRAICECVATLRARK